MSPHAARISAFIRAVQIDTTLTNEQKGRELRQAIDFLEEVLDNYPDLDDADEGEED